VIINNNKMLQRHTAYKVHVGDIFSGQPVFDGDRFSSLQNGDIKISRVNIVGNLIDKYINEERKFCTLTLDDGSGQIRIKGFSDHFELLNQPEIGQTVRVIGLLKHYNDELYVLPEIIKQIDPKWLSVRILEIGKPKTPVTPSVEELKAETMKKLASQTSNTSDIKVESEVVKVTEEKVAPSVEDAIKASSPQQSESTKIDNPKYRA